MFFRIGHFNGVNIWASLIPGLKENMLPATWSLLDLKM